MVFTCPYKGNPILRKPLARGCHPLPYKSCYAQMRTLRLGMGYKSKICMAWQVKDLLGMGCSISKTRKASKAWQRVTNLAYKSKICNPLTCHPLPSRRDGKGWLVLTCMYASRSHALAKRTHQRFVKHRFVWNDI